MVAKVFPADELAERTLEFARRIAALPTMTALLIKESVNQSVDNMGFYNALNACFTLHELNHAHWAEIHDDKTPRGLPEDGIAGLALRPARGPRPPGPGPGRGRVARGGYAGGPRAAALRLGQLAGPGAQHVLLDLAGRRLGQRLEVHPVRRLEVRQPAAHEVGQLPLGYIATGRWSRTRRDAHPSAWSGTATTAASSTSGCAASAFSTSTEAMFSPPLMMMSLLRSVSST